MSHFAYTQPNLSQNTVPQQSCIDLPRPANDYFMSFGRNDDHQTSLRNLPVSRFQQFHQDSFGIDDDSYETSLFLGDLSVYSTEKDIRKLFSPYGIIERIRIKRGSSGKPHLSYGFITFRDKQSAERALAELNGVILLGRALRLGWAEPKSTVKAPKSKVVPLQTAQIHVSYISKQIDMLITEETLRAIFARFGKVVDVAIKKSQYDKRLKLQNGYGFVHFPLTTEGLQAAVDATYNIHQVTIDRVTYDCSLSRYLDEFQLPSPQIYPEFSRKELSGGSLVPNFDFEHPGYPNKFSGSYQFQQRNLDARSDRVPIQGSYSYNDHIPSYSRERFQNGTSSQSFGSTYAPTDTLPQNRQNTDQHISRHPVYASSSFYESQEQANHNLLVHSSDEDITHHLPLHNLHLLSSYDTIRNDRNLGYNTYQKSADHLPIQQFSSSSASTYSNEYFPERNMFLTTATKSKNEGDSFQV